MSKPAAIRVTVEDLESGETTIQEVPAASFILFVTEPAHSAGQQFYPRTGTVVITLKGVKA